MKAAQLDCTELELGPKPYQQDGTQNHLWLHSRGLGAPERHLECKSPHGV